MKTYIFADFDIFSVYLNINSILLKRNTKAMFVVNFSTNTLKSLKIYIVRILTEECD